MTKIGQAAAAILDRAHGKLVAFHSQHGLETGFERRLRNIRTLGHNSARAQCECIQQLSAFKNQRPCPAARAAASRGIDEVQITPAQRARIRGQNRSSKRSKIWVVK